MAKLNLIYETKRLTLKVLKPRDAAKVLDYYNRNKEFLREWEPKKTNSFYTISYQRNSIKQDLISLKFDNSVRFWISTKDDPNKLIGSICFSNIIMGNFKSCFLGYKLDEDEINKGYMTEAIKKGAEIMFNDFGLHRIEVNIIPRNSRSLRVAEKLGLEKEGYSKRYLEIDGVWEDHIHFAMYNDD